MLIRIGDERREMLDQHLLNLKTKCLDFSKYEADTKSVLIETLITVITNLPHKVLVYANFVAFLATENPQFAEEIVQEIVKHLSKCFINDQNAFASRNIFRWLSYLVDLRVVSSESVCQLMLNILEEVQKDSKNFPKDLTLHCVLTFLTTESTSARLQKEQSIDFGSILEIVKNLFKGSIERAQTRAKMLGIPNTNSLIQLWDFYSQSLTKKFPLSSVMLTLSAEKLEELRQKFSDSPVKNLP